MTCLVIEKTIREHKVLVKQLDCTTGLLELSKILKVTDKVAYDYLHGEANIHHHLALIQSCKKEDAEYVQEIASRCIVGDTSFTPATLGFFVQNDYLLLMELFAFFIEANYKDFFVEGLKEIETKKETSQ